MLSRCSVLSKCCSVSKRDLQLLGTASNEESTPGIGSESDDAAAKTNKPLTTPQLYDGNAAVLGFQARLMCSAHERVEDAALLRFTNGGKHSKGSSAYVRT